MTQRDPNCRCGSGAHPRHCAVHPDALDRHCKSMEDEMCLPCCPLCGGELRDADAADWLWCCTDKACALYNVPMKEKAWRELDALRKSTEKRA